jgi:hypothetical protein
MNQEPFLASQLLDSLESELTSDLKESEKTTLQYIRTMAIDGPSPTLLSNSFHNPLVEQAKNKNRFVIELYQGQAKEALDTLEGILDTEPVYFLQSCTISNLLLLKEVESEDSTSKVNMRRHLARKIAQYGGDHLHWSIVGHHLS